MLDVGEIVVRLSAGKRNLVYLFCKTSLNILRSIHHPIQRLPGTVSHGVKRLGPVAYHSLPPSDGKNSLSTDTCAFMTSTETTSSSRRRFDLSPLSYLSYCPVR
jgi:hypothetical protein